MIKIKIKIWRKTNLQYDKNHFPPRYHTWYGHTTYWMATNIGRYSRPGRGTAWWFAITSNLGVFESLV